MGSAIQEWSKFLDRCLHSRLSNVKFEGFAKLLKDRSPVTGSQLAELFLTPKSSKTTTFDPLLPLYIDSLVRCDLVKPSNLLDGLYRFSRLQVFRGPSGPTSSREDEHLPRAYILPELEEMLILDITRMYSTGQQPKSLPELLQVLRAVTVWMFGIVATSTRDEMMQHVTGEANPLSTETLMIRGMIGMLVIALMGNPKVSALLSGTYPKGIFTYL